LKSVRILIVEDELILAKALEICLEDLGYQVVATVTTGEEAILKAEEIRPDLILMDIVLAGEMDGIEAAGRIKSGLRIPFMYMTAYGDKETLERATIAEPLAYLVKPIREHELDSEIKKAFFTAEGRDP
jgi:CheY-like chemotaxis protein